MKRLRIGLSAMLSLLWAGPAVWAQTVVAGEVDAGYQNVNLSANEARFQEYGKVPSGADIPFAGVQVTSDSDTVRFEGRDILQDNQSYQLDYNRAYQMKVSASWDQIPHDYSNVAETLYTQNQKGVLQLPSRVQSTLQPLLGSPVTNTKVANFNNTYGDFMTAAHNADLQTLQTQGGIDMSFRPVKNLRTDLGFSEQQVEGNKPLGASFGFSQALQVPEPIDWKTYNLHAGSQYDTKAVQLGLNYLMSSFNNDIETLSWSNPARATNAGAAGAGGLAGPAQGVMSLAPDNWSHTVTLNGGANLPANTRFTASGTMAYMHQNEALLPFTDNSALAATNPARAPINATSAASLPELSANANVMTWTQDYKVSNRVFKPLSLGLEYRSHQTVDQTDEVAFAGRAIMDSSWETQTGGYVNQGYDLRKDTLTGSADFQALRPLSLGFNYNVEWNHQTNRVVTDSTENGYAVNSDYRPASWTSLRGSYLHAHRVPHSYDYSQYLTPGTTNYSELPGLQQFDIGDRVRDQGKVIWQINPLSAVTIGLNGTLTHDNYQAGGQDLTGATGSANVNYPATLYGLQDNRDSAGGADVGWNASDRLYLDAYYDYEEDNALMRSNEGSGGTITQAAAADWDLRTLDHYHMAGVNATLGGSAARVVTRLGYDVTMSRESDEYLNIGSAVAASAVYANGVAQPVVAGSLISPSETKYMKQDISIRTTIRMTPRASLVLGYLYEKFDVSDWQTQNLYLAGGTAANQYNSFLGANLQNYVAHVGTVLVKYKF